MKFRKKSSRINFFGINSEDFIRYFFGGNASLAIFVLTLICFFLIREAFRFFPEHNEGLKIYRKSGLEYYDLVENELRKYKKVNANLKMAFQAEINFPIMDLNQKYYAVLAFENEVRSKFKEKISLLDEIREKLNGNDISTNADNRKFRVLEKTLTRQIPAEYKDFVTNFKQSTLPELKKIDRAFFNDLKKDFLKFDILKDEEPKILSKFNSKRNERLGEEFDKNLSLNQNFLKLKRAGRKLNQFWSEVRKNALDARDKAVSAKKSAQLACGIFKRILLTCRTDDEVISALKQILSNHYLDFAAKKIFLNFVNERIKEIIPQLEKEDFHNKLHAFLSKSSLLEQFDNKRIINTNIKNQKQIRELKSLFKEFRIPKNQIRNQYVNKFSKKLEKKLSPFVNDFDFSKNFALFSAKCPKHKQIINHLIENLHEVKTDLKTLKLKSPQAKEFLQNFLQQGNELIPILQKTDKKLMDWRYDKKITPFYTFFSFFLGKKWVTNSSIQDKYGILPLFNGSMIISLIAIIIAVPISIFSAIYVNQIAANKEQNIVKPTIEFIGAIPSVVLGFIGIVVLGHFLKEISYIPWLSWLPGFPINERLNMFNAGLLLAFMAVPTIFSLSEDALNNVPSAFKEASLALGASKIQTAIKVIFPTALSGIVSACLLGFGRIIGETMVVLLVAGNRISLPDFSKGLGVITQPSHTMTGIIAQELGEVVQGSIHYRALFMIGFVLFIISLIINFLAQKIIKKYSLANK